MRRSLVLASLAALLASGLAPVGCCLLARDLPDPDPSWRSPWEPMAAAVDEALAGFPGRASVVVLDLRGGGRWERLPEERYHPASTIKLAVALYAHHLVSQGRLRWDDRITYLPEDFESPGGGSLEQAPFFSRYTVEDLVGRALKHSNNIAVNMLGRTFGWEEVRAFTRRIGGELGRGPEYTARAPAAWWAHLYRLMQAGDPNLRPLIRPLEAVPYEGRIAAGLPEGVPYLHKFGSYAGNFHDTALVLGEHPFVLVVCTAGAAEAEADAAIARVTRAVWETFPHE